MRRFFLFVFIGFVFLSTPITPVIGHRDVLAATTDYVDQDFPDAMDAAKNPAIRDMNAVGHVASVNTTMYGDIIRRTLGPVKNVTTKSKDYVYLQQMYKESFAYGAESVVAFIYAHPPANTYAFVQDVGQSLGFIPKHAYAQGIGFSGLSPILPIWKAFRNIAYLILAMFMIVVGFLIMFRKKIDPKTVITVQNALPNIVITLLLITFSYAIVGILIDFMYLVILIMISILQPISKGVIDANTANQFITGNYWLVIQKMFLGGFDAYMNGLIPLFGNFKPIDGTSVTVEGISGAIGVLSSFVTGGIGAIAIGVLGPPLLLLAILALAFIIAVVRLLFLLISAYIQVILALIIAPFQLLLGAFPGNHAFEDWIKNLIANLSVFPITAIMILIGSIIVKYSTTGTKLWGPPMLNPAGNEGMAGVIGLGILFAIPSVAGSLKEVLKAKPAVQAGPGAVIGPVGGAVGQGMQVAYQLSMVKNLFPQKEGKPGGH